MQCPKPTNLPRGTEALLKNMKEKKTRYLVPTGMSRTQEAFIENTAFKTWHLWPVVVTVVRVAGQLITIYYMTQACTGRRQRTQRDGQAGLGTEGGLLQGKCYWSLLGPAWEPQAQKQVQSPSFISQGYHLYVPGMFPL